MNIRKNIRRKAFSLLELLAVVTFLGILAALIVPRMSTSSESAKQKVQQHQIATLQGLTQQYYLKYSEYPKEIDDLIDEGYLFEEPLPPTGGEYEFDENTGEVNIN